MKTISVEALEPSLSDHTVIDVRLHDDFDSSHVPGAISNCIFEVAFAERLNEGASDKNASYVVYGAGEDSQESGMAAVRMESLGYGNVSVLENGLDGWISAGHPVEGSGAPRQLPSIPSGTLPLDLEACSVQWTGRNLLNRHFGNIQLKSGEIEVTDGAPTGGRIVIDMNSMTCSDLEGEMHDGLIGHLKSADFFETETYPEAMFEIQSSTLSDGATPGSQNLIIRGDLTLKGVTSPVEMGAFAGVTPEGKLAAQASFLMDRTQWKVIYGSGKFFRNLGMHLVNDLIDIELKVVTA